MNKLRRFFWEVGKSCYDLEFYRGVRLNHWSRAVKYAAVLAAMTATVVSLLILPMLLLFPKAASQAVDSHVPSGAYVGIAKGQLQTQGFSMPFNFGNDKMPIVIDDSVVGTAMPEMLQSGKEGIVVGRDAVFVSKGRGQYETTAFTEVPDFGVSKEQVMTWVGKWAYPVAVAIFFVILLGMMVGLSLGFAVTSLLWALVGLIAGRSFSLKFNYGQWVATSLHAMTLPTLAGIVMNALHVKIPFVTPVVMVLFIIAVIQDERARPTAAVQAAKEEVKPEVKPPSPEPPKA